MPFNSLLYGNSIHGQDAEEYASQLLLRTRVEELSPQQLALSTLVSRSHYASLEVCFNIGETPKGNELPLSFLLQHTTTQNINLFAAVTKDFDTLDFQYEIEHPGSKTFDITYNVDTPEPHLNFSTFVWYAPSISLTFGVSTGKEGNDLNLIYPIDATKSKSIELSTNISKDFYDLGLRFYVFEKEISGKGLDFRFQTQSTQSNNINFTTLVGKDRIPSANLNFATLIDNNEISELGIASKVVDITSNELNLLSKISRETSNELGLSLKVENPYDIMIACYDVDRDYYIPNVSWRLYKRDYTLGLKNLVNEDHILIDSGVAPDGVVSINLEDYGLENEIEDYYLKAWRWKNSSSIHFKFYPGHKPSLFNAVYLDTGWAAGRSEMGVQNIYPGWNLITVPIKYGYWSSEDGTFVHDGETRATIKNYIMDQIADVYGNPESYINIATTYIGEGEKYHKDYIPGITPDNSSHNFYLGIGNEYAEDGSFIAQLNYVPFWIHNITSTTLSIKWGEWEW